MKHYVYFVSYTFPKDASSWGYGYTDIFVPAPITELETVIEIASVIGNRLRDLAGIQAKTIVVLNYVLLRVEAA